MGRIDRYILRQLVVATLFVGATLTCVVWLTQSLRFVEMIVNRGMSAPLFVYFTLLLLPTFLSVILPVAVLAAVLFVYHRLLTDNELVVLRAGGLSSMAVARPGLVIGVIAALIGYGLNLYLVPVSYRAFKDMQIALRSSFPMVMLQEGVFNSIMKGVTVYVRDRGADGVLHGIVVHDARVPTRPITMMAQSGNIVSGASGPRIVMMNGNRQQVDPKDGHLSLLYFDRYSFDIAAATGSKESRWRDPRERFLPELFNPKPGDSWNPAKLRMEGHNRLAQPLQAIAFAAIALALLLCGEFDRRGQSWRVIAAVAIAVVLEIALLGTKSQGERMPWLAPALYLVSLAPLAVALAALLTGPWHQRRPAPLADPV